MAISKKLHQKGIHNQRKGLKPKRKIVKIDPNQVSVLMHCDFNAVTGFAKVADHIINELSKDKNYKIVVHAINDFSKKPYKVSDNIMVKPTYLNEKGDPFGRMDFLNAMYQTDFDFVFLLNDVEIINQLIPHFNNIKREKKKEGRPVSKIVTYCPIDSEIQNVDIDNFHYIDFPVTYTKYAKRMMEDVNSKMKGKISIISHGLDTKEFYKLDELQILEAKDKYLNKKRSSFIVGSVNRNQVRKDIGALILGFWIFKQQNRKIDSLLYLHMNPKDPSGIDIVRLADRLNLEYGKDILWTPKFNENQGVSIKQLNEIYNLMDVFVSTTTAEGWGLTITEAMATETPVICPTHTAIYEITKKGSLVEQLRSDRPMVFVKDYEKVRATTEPKDVAFALRKVYDQLNHPLSEEGQDLIKRTDKALDHVKKYKWSKMGMEFKKIMDESKLNSNKF